MPNLYCRLLVMLSTLLSASVAIAAPGDYDGDGFSDLTSIQVSRGSSTTSWTTRLATGKRRKVTFKVPGDALVPGNYSAVEPVKPAVVYVTNLRRPLSWHLHIDGSRQQHRLFGIPGDTPVQADYDCDGITDLASKSEDDQSLWRFSLSTGKEVTSVAFGAKGNRVFGADTDGDGCAELVAVRLNNGVVTWSYRKLFDGTTTEIDWGTKGDIPLKPFDINGDGKPDLIVVRQSNGRHIAHVRHSSESSQEFDVGPAGTIPLTGNFTGQNGFAFFNRSRASYNILNRDGSIGEIFFGSRSAIIVRPDGSVVQNGQDERLGQVVTNTTDGEYSCSGSIRRNDGSGGFTHNPENSRNSIKIMLPNSYTGKVESVHVGKNREIIERLYRVTPNEWGNRERYYGRRPPASYPNDLVYIVKLRSGETRCVTIPEPSNRYD